MRRHRHRQRGFTLLETMIALGILAFGLGVLIESTAANVRTSERSDMLGIATQLTRAKLYDIEEQLIRDGFPEMDPPVEEDDFGDEEYGDWKDFTYKVEIVKVELPNLMALQAMSGDPAASGAEGGEDPLMQSPLAGLIAMGGGDAAAASGAGFIESQFDLIRQVLEASIRKVTLTVTWNAGGLDEELVTVAYFTDPSAMNKVMQGLPLSGGAGGGEGGEGTEGGTTPPPTNPNPRTPPANPRTTR
jgi:prepilin-type N-terminal cleavage/methylation domain-containing protein